MKQCAYCKEIKKTTNEHIIPSFLYQFLKELENKIEGWNEIAKKTLPNEAKIKDVCKECNNGILSQLDEYGKTTLKESKILKENYEENEISLKYEFNNLSRWLLKISFNGYRGSTKKEGLFDEFIPFILGKSETPTRSRLAIIGYLAKPETTDQKNKKFNPFQVRVSQIEQDNSKNHTLRSVSFGALFFYIMIFKKGTLPGHASSSIRSFLKKNKNAKEIKRNIKYTEIKTGEFSYLDLSRDQLEREMEAKKQLLTTPYISCSSPAPYRRDTSAHSSPAC